MKPGLLSNLVFHEPYETLHFSCKFTCMSVKFRLCLMQVYSFIKPLVVFPRSMSLICASILALILTMWKAYTRHNTAHVEQYCWCGRLNRLLTAKGTMEVTLGRRFVRRHYGAQNKNVWVAWVWRKDGLKWSNYSKLNPVLMFLTRCRFGHWTHYPTVRTGWKFIRMLQPGRLPNRQLVSSSKYPA